ncbi:hypothetical protein SFRURICE_011481 [Spodoptera frugiperda]|nr:hypothetical protein SFRURICE_011481 [Spodoptera frugiperda]
MLDTRRNFNQLHIALKIYRGIIDAPGLHIELIRLYAPNNYIRARRHRLSVPACRTVARASSPIPRVLSALNSLMEAYPDCDLFVDELKAIKRPDSPLFEYGSPLNKRVYHNNHGFRFIRGCCCCVEYVVPISSDRDTLYHEHRGCATSPRLHTLLMKGPLIETSHNLLNCCNSCKPGYTVDKTMKIPEH